MSVAAAPAWRRVGSVEREEIRARVSEDQAPRPDHLTRQRAARRYADGEMLDGRLSDPRSASWGREGDRWLARIDILGSAAATAEAGAPTFIEGHRPVIALRQVVNSPPAHAPGVAARAPRPGAQEGRHGLRSLGSALPRFLHWDTFFDVPLDEDRGARCLWAADSRRGRPLTRTRVRHVAGMTLSA